MESVTRARRYASDSGAYFALCLYSVRRLWPVAVVPPSFARHVDFAVKVLVISNRSQGLVS